MKAFLTFTQGLAGLMVACLLVAFSFAKASGFGQNPILGWQGIGVDAMTHFYDLSLTDKAGAYLMAGHNSYTDGSFNEAGSKANYPPLLLLATHGICLLFGSADSAGWVLAALVAALLFCISYPLSFWGGLCLGCGFGFGSGALALERGNTDLLLFILMVPMCYAASIRHRLSPLVHSGLYLFASALKIFPALTLPLFFLYWPRQRKRMAGFVLLIGTAYAFTQIYFWKYLFINTPISAANSYGLYTFQDYLPEPKWALMVLVWLVFALLARWNYERLKTSNRPLSNRADTFSLALCVAGAAVFAGTYLFAGSFNYRLIFSLLCIPYLTQQNNWRGWMGALGFALFAAWPAIANNIFWYIPATDFHFWILGSTRQLLGLGLGAWAMGWLAAQCKAMWANED